MPGAVLLGDGARRLKAFASFSLLLATVLFLTSTDRTGDPGNLKADLELVGAVHAGPPSDNAGGRGRSVISPVELLQPKLLTVKLQADDCCSTVCKNVSPPPPPPEEISPPPTEVCTMQSDGTCKSLLNIRCADWRDKADTFAAAKQKDYMQQCMGQDCVQSLESGSDTPGCRFLDGQGFCYAYNSAQMWCANGGDSTYCHDGGADWGQAPLGTATESQTAWTPGTFPYRGGSASQGSMACACMKDCGCNGGKCWCLNADQQPVGPGSYTPDKIYGNKSGKRGECTCFCNDVGARRRSLLAIGSSPTVSLADVRSSGSSFGMVPGRHEEGPALPPLVVSVASSRRLLEECDCTACGDAEDDVCFFEDGTSCPARRSTTWRSLHRPSPRACQSSPERSV